MHVKIKKIDVQNFKGIKSFTAIFDGNVSVKGANATGKTSLFDAYMWCLTGKDSLGQADFQIKAIDDDGKEAHNLDHFVSVSFDIDGENKTYTRIYKEKWTKKRGAARAEFTGHTTDYEVDGLPAKMKDFDADVADALVDPGLLWSLTCSLYFSTALPWQKRREMLFELCGSVSDADIIAGNPEFKELAGIAKAGNIDAVKKKIAREKKATNDELQHIPARIDELLNQIVVVKDIEDADAIKKENDALVAKIAKIEASGPKQSISDAIDKLALGLAKARFAIQEQAAQMDKKYSKRASEVNSEIEKNERELTKIERDVEGHHRDTETFAGSLDRLRAEYAELVARSIQVDRHCPTCNQPLPRERIVDAVTRLQRDKERRIEENKKAGLEAKAAHAASILARDKSAEQAQCLRDKLTALHEKSVALGQDRAANMPAADTR